MMRLRCRHYNSLLIIIFTTVTVINQISSFSFSRSSIDSNGCNSNRNIQNIDSTQKVQHFLSGVGVTSVIFKKPNYQYYNKFNIQTNQINNHHNDHTDCHKQDHPQSQQQLYIGTKRGRLKELFIDSNHNYIEREITNNYYNDNEHQYQHQQNQNNDNSFTLKPFPIYSIDQGYYQSSELIICGGGDRYITIWQKKTNDTKDNNYNDHDHQDHQDHQDWSISSQLGPHTGWVKDIIYDESNQLIYSIGCNCIEVWSSNDTIIWRHEQKLTVDSCKDKGSTLSSDLLCLCLVRNYSYHNNNDMDDECNSSDSSSKNHCDDIKFLYAGGVDGRIHKWTIQKVLQNQASKVQRINHDENLNTSMRRNTKLNIKSVNNKRAHNGRLNKMIICDELGLLISIGNDGMIQLHDVVRNGSSGDNNVYILRVQLYNNIILLKVINIQWDFKEGDCVEGTVRLSTICCIHQDLNKAIIAIGTSTGTIFLIKIVRHVPFIASNSTRYDAAFDQFEKDFNVEMMTDILHLNNSPNIHDMSLCSLSKKNENIEDEDDQQQIITIAIGHSNGLTLWEIEAP